MNKSNHNYVIWASRMKSRGFREWKKTFCFHTALDLYKWLEKIYNKHSAKCIHVQLVNTSNGNFKDFYLHGINDFIYVDQHIN